MAKYSVISSFSPTGPALRSGSALNKLVGLLNSWAGNVSSTFYDLYPNSVFAQGNITALQILSSFNGIGYTTGAGGTAVQGTSRTTTVTINKLSGNITLVSDTGTTTPQSFTVSNSVVNAADVPVVVQKSGTDLYEIFVTAVGAGSFKVTCFTTGGTTVETPVFNFAVLKGATA